MLTNQPTNVVCCSILLYYYFLFLYIHIFCFIWIMNIYEEKEFFSVKTEQFLFFSFLVESTKVEWVCFSTCSFEFEFKTKISVCYLSAVGFSEFFRSTFVVKSKDQIFICLCTNGVGFCVSSSSLTFVSFPKFPITSDQSKP
jgi:hypothetical protein